MSTTDLESSLELAALAVPHPVSSTVKPGRRFI
jgi:hypothetical protein